MRYGAEYGYGGAEHGYGAEDFVSIYDALPAPESLWSVARRLRRAYTGPVIRVRRSSDNAEQDFYGSGASGLVSPSAIRAFNGWNLVSHSEDISNVTSWAVSTGGSGTGPTRTLSVGGGPNGLNATQIQCSLGGGTASTDISVVNGGSGSSYTITNGTTYTISFWAKSNDSNTYSVQRRLSNSSDIISITPTWQRFTRTITAGADATRFWIGLRGGQTPACSNTCDILVSEPQIEVASAFTTYEPRTTTGAGSSFLVTRYDQSGNARHATQATTTLQPIVCESGVPVVNSGGRLTSKHVAADARRLAVASSTNIYNFLHTTGGTVLAVSQANDTAANKAILANTTGSSLAGFALLRESVSERTQIFTSRIDVAGVATTGTSVSQTAANDEGTILNSVLVINIDPDNASAASRVETFQNGTKITVDNAATDMPFVENAGGNMTIGARSGASIPFDGTIGDIGIWEGFLTEAQRKLVEADQGRFNTITVAP